MSEPPGLHDPGASAGRATEIVRDRLRVAVYADRQALGAGAGAYAAQRLRAKIDELGRARVIFAAAPSQREMLEALAVAPGIDWSRVEAFHLDDYVGLPIGHRRSFGAWLDRAIWDRVKPGRIERIDGGNPAGAQAEAERYGALLGIGGIDLALVGVGENGHVAFNDPHVADFDDPAIVKPVEIDDVARNQQVRDGGFERFEDVPRLALTVTMSTILAVPVLSIVVPGAQKAAAIAAMLDGPVSTACPASALRRHPDALLHVDLAAYALVAAPRIGPGASAEA